MEEQIMVNGAKWVVFQRKATADVMLGTFGRNLLERLGARGYIYLVKPHGTRVYRAIEQASGTIGYPAGNLMDTHTTVTGRGVR